MCPLHLGGLSILALATLRKWLKEESSGDASTRAATSLHVWLAWPGLKEGRKTDVLEIGIGSMDLGEVVIVEGHAPETVVFNLAGGLELLPEFVRSLDGERQNPSRSTRVYDAQKRHRYTPLQEQ